MTCKPDCICKCNKISCMCWPLPSLNRELEEIKEKNK